MRKLKMVALSTALAAMGLVGTASPSSAMVCHDSIEDACAVAATVICKVVAKGQPCLN